MRQKTARVNMIKQQLLPNGVIDQRIISLYSEVHREDFVEDNYTNFAYSDLQISLPHQQRMMTPLEECLLLQACQFKGHEVVLEIGTGTGFLTALLSRLCQRVISIDCFQSFTTYAQKKLAALSCKNVELVTGDASQGWYEAAPYDVIIFTSGMASINESQRLQLLPGGKLFAIIGQDPVMQGQLHHLDHQEHWSQTLCFETCLPALITTKDSGHSFVF